MQLITLFEGRGLSFKDFIKKADMDDENFTLTLSEDKPLPSTLFLMVQEDGILFPVIQYKGDQAVYICGRFQIKDRESWIDVDLSSLPHNMEDLVDSLNKGHMEIKLSKRDDRNSDK